MTASNILDVWSTI